MSEAELVKELQSGSESAFKELVTLYQQMIIVTCYGYLHNQEEAEDVAQEVFIQVYKSIGKFRGDAKLSTWLYRIAINRSLNKIRSRKSRFLVGLDILFESGSKEGHNPELNPYDSLLNDERATILHQAIDKLPENQKTAFILSKYEGLANKKIAEVMEMSLSAVEALLNRGKKKLQEKLVDYYKK